MIDTTQATLMSTIEMKFRLKGILHLLTGLVFQGMTGTNLMQHH